VKADQTPNGLLRNQRSYSMKNLRRLNRLAAAFAAGAMLFAADGALAHGDHGDHGHSSDSNQMKSHDSKSDHSDKHSDRHKDKDSKHAEKMKAKEEKRAERKKEKEEKRAEKKNDKDKDKTGTTTTANGTTPTVNGGKDDLYGKGFVGPNTNLKPVPGSGAPGTAASGATPGPTAINNTIHPIPSPPAAPALGSGNGIIRVTDQRGNSIIIPDHGKGVTVTPAGPGHVTISNGDTSQTVAGVALNISGAKTVTVDKSLGVGRPPADGSTTVLTPNGTVTNESVLPDGTFQATRDGHTP
jgi:hypothetical protein